MYFILFKFQLFYNKIEDIQSSMKKLTLDAADEELLKVYSSENILMTS